MFSVGLLLLQCNHEHGSEERNPAPCELSQGSGGRGGSVVVGAALLGGDGVDVCEADLSRVVAVCLVDFGESLVSRLGKNDVDAL